MKEELKLRIYGDPVLREKSTPVEKFDEDLKETIKKMAELMYKVKGLGLAANQVGIPKRFFIMDIKQKEGTPELEVYINPEILNAEGYTEYEEGCLSIPGYYAKVERYAKLYIRAYDLEGKPFEKELTGLQAIAFQHEYDHIEGILFVDRISPLKKELFKRWWKKREKELVGK
ncbi:MAG: peptide deformylase [Caldimicrobium sp.]|jgi:peptide deformylase|nr:peptide deformylase [Caldimicrobium sp.]